MTLYNAIIALPAAVAAELIAYRDENGGEMPRGMPSPEWAANVWRNPPGYVSYDVQSAALSDLDTLLAAYPEARVYGAWDRDTGAIVRPLRDDCIDLMPDVVTIDESGAETLRRRPERVTDHHKWLGQHSRDWSDR